MPELLHLYTYIELYAIYFSVHTVWAKMFGPGLVTALICSGRNQTEPDTRYSYTLDCS